MTGKRLCSEHDLFVLLVLLQDEDERFFKLCALLLSLPLFVLPGGVSAADFVPGECNRGARNRHRIAAHSVHWSTMNLGNSCFQRTEHRNPMRSQLWTNTAG